MAVMSSRQVWRRCALCNGGRKTCFSCGGSGKVAPGWQKCNECNGFGTVMCTNCAGNGGWRETIWGGN